MKQILRLPACLLVAAVIGATGAVDADEVPQQRVDDRLAGWPLAKFELYDQHGTPFTNERLMGKWTFVLIGDTQCGAPCAAALTALVGMNRRIAGTTKAAQVLFVSLAPRRDPPAALAAHLAVFDPRFIGASGAPETLTPLLEDLAPTLVPATATATATVTDQGVSRSYSGSLFLVGPDGALRGEFLPPFDVPRLTATYLKLRLRG